MIIDFETRRILVPNEYADSELKPQKLRYINAGAITLLCFVAYIVGLLCIFY